MAENKKSFVLYCDLIDNIDHLSNEEKGILFTHLLEYVNDKNPTLNDRLILTAWKPIERQLKRDLIKFEEVKSKRSDAGKRSAELRALKNEEQNATNSTSVESVQQTSTNPTVNDNVNVSVNVNDNVILLKKETKRDLLIPIEFTEIWDLWLEYRKAKKIKNYAGEKFEQMAFDKLLKYSNSNLKVAEEIINESITNGWTGFFELKTNNNGKQQPTTNEPTIGRQTISNIEANLKGWE